MTYEAIMISYFIPSQVLSQIQATQATLNAALLRYASNLQPGVGSHHTLDSSLIVHQKDNTENVCNTSNRDNYQNFSASTYLFPSVLVAQKFRDLPESDFILSYVDPLPHNFAELKSSHFVSTVNNSPDNYVEPHHGNNVKPNAHYSAIRGHNKWWSRVMRLCTSASIISLFIYIGTLPILFQRCLVVLPLPLICGAITSLIIAVLNLSPYLYIPLNAIFLLVILYSSYIITKLIFEHISFLTRIHRDEDEYRLQLISSLDSFNDEIPNVGCLQTRGLDDDNSGGTIEQGYADLEVDVEEHSSEEYSTEGQVEDEENTTIDKMGISPQNTEGEFSVKSPKKTKLNRQFTKPLSHSNMESVGINNVEDDEVESLGDFKVKVVKRNKRKVIMKQKASKTARYRRSGTKKTKNADNKLRKTKH